jgi:hypothetical protein
MAASVPALSGRVLRSQTAAQAANTSRVDKSKPKSRRRRLDPWAPKRRPNPNPKPRAPPATHYTCRICIEEQAAAEFPKWVPLKRGKWNQPWEVPFDCIAHLARNPRRRKVDPVCKTCIGRVMSSQLDMLGARQVSGCVEPGCGVQWHFDYIIKYMPNGEPLEKYNIEMFEVWKHDATDKLVTCSAPGCNAIGLSDPTAPGYPQISCHSCGYRSCARCLVPWHKDLTCSEHAAKHVDEKMSDPEKDTLKLMQTKNGKRCPNCYLVIEKDGGCDSMHCVGCHKYFNWATAGKISVIKFAYLRLILCDQHPQSLVLQKPSLSIITIPTCIEPQRCQWRANRMPYRTRLSVPS